MADWLSDGESRIGLGCMRLSTDADCDSDRALNTIAAALAAGLTVFDTARAYGLDDADRGHNERLLAQALREHPSARVVTKGGMARPGGDWQPDGRARAIFDDCDASLQALGGRIDLYLLHAPDPRTSFATSVRALAQLADDKRVPRVGLCNVSRRQLKEALDLAPISAVQVSLGHGSDDALRGGVVSLALERGLDVMTHSPFGGVKSALRLGRDKQLVRLQPGATPAQLVLAWLLSLHPRVVALPGARRPESARSAAAAAHIVLDEATRAALAERYGTLSLPSLSGDGVGDGEVVLVAGLSGSGKSTLAAGLLARGYDRLNRDQRGGSLASLTAALDRKLAQGRRRLVLDNTYVTRASRYDVLRVAARHQVPVRCLWLDTPAIDAQRNIIERMLAQHGRLLGPEEMKGDDPSRLPPRALNNQLRQLEPPEEDEGFRLERVPFVMKRVPDRDRAGRAVALEALSALRLHAAGPTLENAGPTRVNASPTLVFAWLPDGEEPLLNATRGLDVETAACCHPAGPPLCWCRPPLPGLLIDFARRHRIDLARLTVVGTSTAHRKLAEAAGAGFELVTEA